MSLVLGKCGYLRFGYVTDLGTIVEKSLFLPGADRPEKQTIEFKVRFFAGWYRKMDRFVDP